MFKKPKRNFRSRREAAEDKSFSDEKEVIDLTGPNGDAHGTTKDKAKKKSKKHDKQEKKTALSFEDDLEGDEGTLFVKKSSHSKRVANKLRNELRREKEDKKREREIKDSKPKEVPLSSANGNSPVIRNGDDAAAMVDLSDDEDDLDLPEGYSPEQDQDDARVKTILEGGAIPDAATIHMIRQRRERARQQADYMPLNEDEDKNSPRDEGRLVRDDDNDKSDDEGERINFTSEGRDAKLRKMQAQFIEAEEQDLVEEHEDEWVEQQIRKGTNVPTAAAVERGPGQLNEEQMAYIEQYQQQLQNQQQQYMESSFTQRQAALPVNLPKLDVEQVAKDLQNRLHSLVGVHRAHKQELVDMESRSEASEEAISKSEAQKPDFEANYKFFQDMRGYVRDLVECLNEKVPQISHLEGKFLRLWSTRAERLVKRRKMDVEDQSSDLLNMKTPDLKQPPDEAKQRRVTEREARRARRRRAREDKTIKDHNDGMSSDDEEQNSDISKYNSERDSIRSSLEHLMDDVTDDFGQLRCVKERFERWKETHRENYDEAFIGLCLPKLFSPFVRLQLVEWNPLQGEQAAELEDTGWYKTLMFYGADPGVEIRSDDCDAKIVPGILEKVVLPRLSELVENVWDPLSSQQTIRLVRLVRRLTSYPVMNSESKSSLMLMGSIVTRIRRVLDEEVYIPIFDRQLMADKRTGHSAFHERQFWTCVKLLNNIMQWNELLSAAALQELALDSLLNRYVMMGLSTVTLTDKSCLFKIQMVSSTFPREWFHDLKGDSTLPQLSGFCRFLMHVAKANAEAAAEQDNKMFRDNARQVTKVLVGIHALDHALIIANQFNIRVS